MAEFLLNVLGYFAVALFLIAAFHLVMMSSNLQDDDEKITSLTNASWMMNWLTFMFTLNKKYLPEKARPHWANGQKYLLAAAVIMTCVVFADSLIETR